MHGTAAPSSADQAPHFNPHPTPYTFECPEQVKHGGAKLSSELAERIIRTLVANNNVLLLRVRPRHPAPNHPFHNRYKLNCVCWWSPTHVPAEVGN